MVRFRKNQKLDDSESTPCSSENGTIVPFLSRIPCRRTLGPFAHSRTLESGYERLVPHSPLDTLASCFPEFQICTSRIPLSLLQASQTFLFALIRMIRGQAST